VPRISTELLVCRGLQLSRSTRQEIQCTGPGPGTNIDAVRDSVHDSPNTVRARDPLSLSLEVVDSLLRLLPQCLG
jgi:hypothetical protein